MMDIIFTSRLNQTDLEIAECGTQKCAPGYSYGPALRDFYLIHFIHSGRGLFRIGDREFYLKAGDLFLIPPNLKIFYCADSINPWHYSWIAFHGTKAEFYLKRANLSQENPVVSSNCYEYINQCFKDMMSTRNSSRNKEIYLLGIFYLLLSNLIEQAPVNSLDEVDADSKQDYVNKAVEFIKINYSKKISITNIAEHVGVDSKYLCKVFKAKLKISPYKFLLCIRIDKACELLQNDTLTIGDISRSVGYEDQLLFSKMFKRSKGISPREFRQSYMKEAG
jgi:AraC-like DNA-binding protein